MKKKLLLSLMITSLSLEATLYNIKNWSNYTVIINSNQQGSESITCLAKTVLINKQICGDITIQAIGAPGNSNKQTLTLNCYDPRILDLTINNDGHGGIMATTSFENRPNQYIYKEILKSLQVIQKIFIKIQKN